MNFYSTFSVATLQHRGHDTISHKTIYPELALGLFITKNLELIAGFPLRTNEVKPESSTIDAAGKIRASLKYNIYDKVVDFGFNGYYIECIYSSFFIRTTETYSNAVGIGAGMNFNIYSLSSFHVNGIFGINYSKLIERPFADYYETSLRFGVFANL